MSNYSVEIIESSKELTLRDRIKIKDISDTISLDKAVKELNETGERLLLDVEYYAVLRVHNENSKDKEYTKYIIGTKDGKRYNTCSESFWNSFKDIQTEVYEAGETNFSIECYAKESKNYEGKYFLTCSIG